MISEQEFHDLSDFIRQNRDSDAAERHAYLVATLIDDLAEGESLNALDYQVLRTAAIMHDAAGPHPGDPGSAAQLAAEQLRMMEKDDGFVEAVCSAIRRAAPDAQETPMTLAEQLTADACALALMLQTRAVSPTLHSMTASRIARAILEGAPGVTAPA